MYEYNRSTGIIRDEDRRRREIELTVSEMKIMEILLDGEWHKGEEIEEKAGIKKGSRIVHISRLKKKIKRYIEIENKKGEYRCERIKSEQERQ